MRKIRMRFTYGDYYLEFDVVVNGRTKQAQCPDCKTQTDDDYQWASFPFCESCHKRRFGINSLKSFDPGH